MSEQEGVDLLVIERATKKPVTVDAAQFTDDAQAQSLIRWITAGGAEARIGAFGLPIIVTLEGAMQVSRNDWVIKGVSGEFYPCKPDIFDKTYSVVGADSGMRNVQLRGDMLISELLGQFPDGTVLREGLTVDEVLALLQGK